MEKKPRPIFTNIVSEKDMREVQKSTLEIIKNALSKSFGPYGTTTLISKDAGGGNVQVNYSKDGHTILKSLMFQRVIETAVKEDVEAITRNIVSKVGDGTTSAVILASYIFNEMLKLEQRMPPHKLVENFNTAVKAVVEEISTHGQEFTAETARNIAYVSTNGNAVVAENIRNIYDMHGKDVYIDVAVSPSQESMLKTYDGMTLETGYADTSFVNTTKGESSIRTPQIYVFDDPIDTPQMGGFLDAIISTNIFAQINNQQAPIPTVVFAPKISRAFSAYMSKIAEILYQIQNPLDKPPLLIVTNIDEADKYADIAHLCGAKAIKKYISPDLYKKDVDDGLAPTIETIFTFAGSADLVEANALRTKVINPKHMYKEGTTEYSDVFQNLVRFLEAEISKLNEESNNATRKYKLKRRLQSLKANLVEYNVGGITLSDRDSLRDLVEDAVKNCRSAAQSGAGFGSNFEGLRAAKLLMDQNSENEMFKVLYNAYKETVSELYRVSVIPGDIDTVIEKTIELGMPYDIRNDEYNATILTSIDTDKCILEGISKIITLMVTTNQFLTPDFHLNNYTQNM